MTSIADYPIFISKTNRYITSNVSQQFIKGRKMKFNSNSLKFKFFYLRTIKKFFVLFINLWKCTTDKLQYCADFSANRISPNPKYNNLFHYIETVSKFGFNKIAYRKKCSWMFRPYSLKKTRKTKGFSFHFLQISVVFGAWYNSRNMQTRRTNSDQQKNDFKTYKNIENKERRLHCS